MTTTKRYWRNRLICWHSRAGRRLDFSSNGTVVYCGKCYRKLLGIYDFNAPILRVSTQERSGPPAVGSRAERNAQVPRFKSGVTLRVPSEYRTEGVSR